MDVDQEERSKVIAWIRDAFSLALNAGNITSDVHSLLLRCLRLQWSARMTRTIGSAETDTGTARIKLSAVLWPVCSEEEKKETVMHEAAHLMVTVSLGAAIPPHGKEWKETMRILGYDAPSLYHTVMSEKAEVARGNKPVYCECPTSPHTWVTPKHKRKIEKGKTTICRQCKALVRFLPF